jgi:DNA-binding NtrC family response regulator
MKSQSILLVDDEEIVLKTIFFDLQECGYQVDMVESAKEALIQVEKNSYDLLITDFVMEGMSGMDLIAAVKKSCPHMMTILLTGYQNWLDDTTRLDVVDDYLQKPCRIAEVRFRVARCFEKLDMQRRISALQNPAP